MNALSKGQLTRISTVRNLDRELTDTELENIIGGGILRGLPYYAMINTDNFGATGKRNMLWSVSASSLPAS